PNKGSRWLGGFEYDVYTKENDIVFAFRGSDGFFDYIFSNFAIISPSYRQARNLISSYSQSEDGKGRNIILVGHSL
ncbi:hypothetical protein ABTC61_18855, partial [Acinetobacter baumannii]